MSGFHAMYIFIAVIGKIYGDAGLRDFSIESGISGKGRVEQVLRGKRCNNALFCNLCVYESLYRLKINALENWLTMKGKYQLFWDFAENTNLSESNDVSDLTREEDKENMVNASEAHRELLNLMCE